MALSISFADLLRSAVTEPGIVSAAYKQFHNYSIGNQLFALGQCLDRGLQPGPLATYQRWRELGRQVRKGEKAITLCQPVTVKRTVEAETGTEDSVAFTRFVCRAGWFVLSQTDGGDVSTPPIPEWSAEQSLATLDVNEIPFRHSNGNALGYAVDRSIAINPVNPLPHKTRFHELAHVLLGHTTEGMHSDVEVTSRNLREVEAEAVALLCLLALRLPGAEFCRGYIQSWWGAGNPIPERSAQRILKAADQILKAGRPAATGGGEVAA
jgi:antirestriction protein ArdC